MKIKVTKKDIDSGFRNSEMSCPIARAMRAVSEELGVTKTAIWFMSDNADREFISIPLPEAAKDFIKRFDNFLPVKPFTFEIPLS